MGFIISDNNCIRGFPDIPVSEVGPHTRNSITTLLIPEMNFTCNATIVGFIVAGRNLDIYSWPYSRVQIWHRNSSQNSSVYYQVRFGFFVTFGVCVAARAIVNDTFWCILRDRLQVSVRPGDILGLELPNNDEIFFTSGGPVNYIFGHRPNSNVNLSNNGTYSNAQQLPQIVFNLTSGDSELCVLGLIINYIQIHCQFRDQKQAIIIDYILYIQWNLRIKDTLGTI